MIFVDTAKVFVKSGSGGKGCVSFRREKYKPRGGPDGGDGGDGGNVIFVGDLAINSLAKFRYAPRLVAARGAHGKGSNKSGRKGKDVIVQVPCGTILKHLDTDEILCEITEPGVAVTVARGGKGGKGNQHFATATRQAPRYAQEGLPGSEYRVLLELKVMADVGLVGLPNAGKSSLIAAVSRATPKIADYPFTTLHPVVGVIELPGHRTIVMADIPGIIEGASRGKGLGHRFLKHVERTKVLLFVIDVSSLADTPAAAALATLQNELRLFGHELEHKKFLIAANKTDLDADHSALQEFLSQIDRTLSPKVFPVSAVTRAGISRLVGALDREIQGS